MRSGRFRVIVAMPSATEYRISSVMGGVWHHDGRGRGGIPVTFPSRWWAFALVPSMNSQADLRE